MTLRAAAGLALTAAGLCLAAACRSEPAVPAEEVRAPGAGPRSAASGSRPAAIEAPALEGLDPAVGDQLREMRRRVSQAVEQGLDPETLAVAYGKLGRAYQAYELWDAARGSYRNAIALDPRDHRWPYYLGHVERAAGRLEEAVGLFERVLELAGADVPALVALAQLHRELLRADAAGAYARRALAADPAAAAAILVLAELAGDRRDPAAAVRHYEAILRLQPQATKLYQPLALAYRDLGQVERAKELLARRGDGTVTAADPLLAELEELKAGSSSELTAGIQAFDRGDYRQAVAILERAVERDPEHPEARLNLGSSLFRLGQIESAIAHYRAAVRLDPEYAMAHFNLGTALARQGDDPGAIRHYREALRLDGEIREARFNLSNALRRQGRCDEALEHYRALLEDDPGNGPAGLGEAVCLIAVERFAAARERLEQSRRLFPQSPTVVDVSARFLAACPDGSYRDGAEALALARRLVGLERRPGYLETLAMALAENGRFDAAVEAQKEALAGARSAGDSALAARLEKHLALYRRGEPCREPAVD